MDLPRLLKERYQSGSRANAILALARPPLDYAGLFEHCAATLASLNGARISRGDRVAVVLPNGPEMATCFLAVMMGASCAPLNPTYRRSEFEFYLADLAPRALIVEEGVDSPAIEVAEARGIRVIRLRPSTTQAAGIFSLDFGGPVARVAPVFAHDGDEALVLHTSGTTARPKMVPLTHANLGASAASIAASLGLSVNDRCLNVMPLFHIHGLVGALLSTIASGGSIVCSPGFQAPRFMEWCEEFQPTWYTAVPTMHQAVLARARHEHAPRDNHKLRFIRSCSAALAPQLMTELEETFKVPVIEAYGMTEASHQIATNPLPPKARKAGSVGQPAGAEVALMDDAGNLLDAGAVGEIVLRGPGLTAGYAQNPDANRTSFTNGWFRTGDQGTIDADGYVFITGRLKEMINRGGQKISPREIDEVLSTHPAVAQAVAFAVPDHRLGEEIAAAVVLRPGHVASEGEIRNHAAQLIADYKVPHRVVFLDELPKGPTGKLQRIGLARQLGLDNPTSSSRPIEYLAPRTPTERIIADVWQQVLGVERIGVNDDFLALGGDSMLAALAIARIRAIGNAYLSVLEFFEHPTIAQLAELIDSGGEDRAHASDPIVASSTSGDLPLSSAQSRMWFLSEFDENSTAYNRSNLFRIRGEFQPRALEHAFEEVVARHAVLRTTFRSRDGEPVQVVSPPGPVAIKQLDLSDVPDPSRMERALAAVVEAANLKFDLTRDPMIRSLLVKLDADDHLLAFTMHHIASDGWSAGVLMRELSALYAARISDDDGADRHPLKPLAIQYSDFARWQSQAVHRPRMLASLEWWKRQLAGAPPLLALPSDRPRPPRQTFTGAAETFVIAKETSDRLKEIARGERATLFMTLLTAFQTMLHRYTGIDDIVIGAFVAGRTRVETEGLIGLFVNTLAVRGNLAGDPTFSEMLRRTREFAFEAYGHQDLPFDMVVDSIHPHRNLSYQPIFQVTFQVRNYPVEDTQLVGLEVEEVDFDSKIAPFDLSFEVTEKAGALFCKLIYNTDLFDRATIARMAGHFETLLGGIVKDPGTPISRLPLITPDERRQLLIDWNDTRRDYPHECVHRLFEAQAERTPDAVAVTFGASQMSYAELNSRANQLARLLIEAGVMPRSHVAICIDRSPYMYVGIVGVLKAGAAYVPLDPAYPPQRLDYMLSDSGASVLVTTQRHSERFARPGLSVIEVDRIGPRPRIQQAFSSVEVDLDEPIYVLYTSGSTGVPKGVVGSHRGVVNRLQWMWDAYPFSAGEIACQKTALSFVDSVAEIFGPLLKGVPTVIVGDQDVRDPRRLIDIMSRARVTRIVLVPSVLEAVLDSDLDLGTALSQLRLWVSSGEALGADLVRRFYSRLPSARLLNLYGSTEIAADATATEIQAVAPDATPSIGRPIANTSIYILDRHLEPVPIGAPGEICIGGAGLARRYHNVPELTARKFIANPFDPEPGARLFMTGDLGRHRSDGNIEYMGRRDSVVKIRGIRIDLGELEANLAAHPAIKTAAASTLSANNGDLMLVAWVESCGEERPSLTELKEFLAERIPEQMIPSQIAFVEKMPTTPSGKIDRVALVASNTWTRQSELDFVAPRDDIERRLQAIWEEILDVRPIGIRHEFFEMGGHSLNAARVLSRIEREFSFHIPLAAMFPAPTIETLALRIRGDSPEGVRTATVPIQPHGALPPLFVVGNFQVFRDLARYLGQDQPMIGLTLPDELRMRLPYKVEELAAHQVSSILNYQEAGPYFIAGFSAEGVLAYEVAQQLRAKGRVVGLLVMIDTPCPTQPRESWAVRTEQKITIFRNKLWYEGINSTRISLWRRVQRAAIRLKIIRWRVGGKVGVEFKQAAPKRPDDFFNSMRTATWRYVPQPYGGRVLLFKRTSDLTGRYRLKDFGWSKVLDQLEIFDIDGYHWTLLTRPGVGELAKKLEAAMRQARESAAGIDSSESGYHGQAVTLPQIEARLTKHPGVSQAAVTALRDASGDQKILAYVVPDRAYLDSLLAAEQSEDQRIKEWLSVFDWFQADEEPASTGFDIRLWNSSYTKQPIPADEMREWVDSTVEEILPLHPAEVLEVGCGTGLLLLRIAPTSKRYVGVDFSAASLKSLRQQMEASGTVNSAVTLLERQADDFTGLDKNSFDTVIINSVLQYLPSLEYLTRVLDGVLEAAKPRSAIFIGDVRSLPLLEAFSASVELFHAPSSLRLSSLREKIGRRLNQERELVISPAFFLALQRRYPQISRVEIRPKWGSADNEMNRFRYSVTLFLDPHHQKFIEPQWLDWTDEGLTLESIRGLLERGIETIAIKGVVNARVEKDVKALARLASADDAWTAGELRDAVDNEPARGMTPAELHSLAKEFDYRAEISWAACRAYGSFDVVLRPFAAGDETIAPPVAWPQPETIDHDLTHHVFDPSRIARRQMLVRQLRDHAKATLPESMIPADFVLVDALPLTSDGAIDRVALSTAESSAVTRAEERVDSSAAAG